VHIVAISALQPFGVVNAVFERSVSLMMAFAASRLWLILFMGEFFDPCMAIRARNPGV
jgi:hypothetical protein